MAKHVANHDYYLKDEDARDENFRRYAVGNATDKEYHRQSEAVRYDILLLPDGLSNVEIKTKLIRNDPDVEVTLLKIRGVSRGHQTNERYEKSVVLLACFIGLFEHGKELAAERFLFMVLCFSLVSYIRLCDHEIHKNCPYDLHRR